MKRTFDLVVSLAILSLVLPILVFLIPILLFTQGRPIFFFQERVGRGGKPFHLYKFRTMIPNAESVGPKVTVGGDPRITAIGRILRKTKLDELPQLFNVLRGDMSLVGPRPEVDEYVRLYDDTQQMVLSVRPGITDVASLKYFDESERLAKQVNPREYYIDVIMPDKIKLNLEYIEKASILQDLAIVAKTALRIIRPTSKEFS